MSNVIKRYKNNIHELEENLVSIKPVNDLHKVTLKNQLYENKNNSSAGWFSCFKKKSVKEDLKEKEKF